MFQWPLIVVLVVSMFVGRVCPALQKEGHVDGDDHVSTKGNNTIVLNKKIESLNNTVKDKKENQHGTGSLAPLKNTTEESPSSVEKTIENGKNNCSSKKEVDDMISCNVIPPDEDTIIEQNSNTTEPTNTTLAANNKTETSTESQVTKVSPQESNEKESVKEIMEIDVPLNKSDIMETGMPLNDSDVINKTFYDVVSMEKNHSIHTNDSEVLGTTSKQGTSTSETSVNSVAPLQADNIAIDTQSADVVGAVKSSDKDNDKPMPSGLIALVTAISFAVAIAIVYIGMIIWRRYIEYRYGHRELLVNELEFDTNDLRHFEL